MNSWSDSRPEAADSASNGYFARPFMLAAGFAAVYAACCLVYIMVSGVIARRAAKSLEELEFIESVKGSLFVLASSLILFILIYVLMTIVRRRERELLEHRRALIQSEQR